ncbi:hypothetical protein [Clostridium cochlearium]|uniref:hypothetical protein n=1 Tax=Clostridium cochlearium TaxID=1494 RepID=UPI000DF0F917|nr:Uncharacterised protein [Clostridium cochlearium]
MDISKIISSLSWNKKLKFLEQLIIGRKKKRQENVKLIKRCIGVGRKERTILGKIVKYPLLKPMASMLRTYFLYKLSKF